jgi:hypothetical protein
MFWVEIQNGHFPGAKLLRCRYTRLLGVILQRRTVNTENDSVKLHFSFTLTVRCWGTLTLLMFHTQNADI